MPVGNLIGEENSGFKYIMHNFNHERWGFVVQAWKSVRPFTPRVRPPQLVFNLLSLTAYYNRLNK